ncbi:globin [Paenibacillus sp. S-12]|uniref:globin domain-containing protein n=1 Tax=Paenibacillus sp. S-12 TaxID=3031371 RepID=UPI0025A0297D|nr:globin [Paenibacillus sp. S-12]
MERYSQSIYEAIGGEATVRKMVEAFYPRVQAHPLLAPLFPEDIEPVMERQFMFLTQFFGGPPIYSDQFGHPMMRARHLPFPVTRERADAWLGCMREVLHEINMEPGLATMVIDRLSGPAYHFINTNDEA